MSKYSNIAKSEKLSIFSVNISKGVGAHNLKTLDNTLSNKANNL